MAFFKNLERALNRLDDWAFRNLWGEPASRISEPQKCKFEEHLADNEKRLLSVFATREIQEQVMAEYEFAKKHHLL